MVRSERNADSGARAARARERASVNAREAASGGAVGQRGRGGRERRSTDDTCGSVVSFSPVAAVHSRLYTQQSCQTFSLLFFFFSYTTECLYRAVLIRARAT